jgi:hypothetical protein
MSPPLYVGPARKQQNTGSKKILYQSGHLTVKINILKLTYYSEFCIILSSADTEIFHLLFFFFLFAYFIALLFSEQPVYTKFNPTQKIGSTIYG